MSVMRGDEWKHFIGEQARPGIVAVVRADGRPHCTPTWIDLDGDAIVFTTFRDSLKGKALRRDNRVAICINDDRPPFSYVVIQGTATLSEDLDQLRYWAGRLGARYMGTEHEREYADRNGVPGELLVRVTVTHVAGARDIAL